MNAFFRSRYTILIVCITFLILILLQISKSNLVIQPQKVYAVSPIQHVFIILMENHDWRTIKGSSQATYINNTLLPMGAHAEQYFNPPNNHPSAPNYVWLEAGAAVAGASDCKPTDSGCNSSANHLTKLLDTAGISWREYAEGATGTSCILSYSPVDVNHVPFSYFTDVTNNNNPNSAYCISHERPFTQLATDLQNNTIARYNFISPNLTDDMHDGTIQQGDTWLSKTVPMIMNSQAYKNGGAIFITWDEGEGDDGPVGMIVESPYAKKNYSNTIHYDHSSTLRTMEEIFGVSPMLGGAANATDLSNFFTVNIKNTGGTNTPPSPSIITPTNYCLGGTCGSSPSPSSAVGSGKGNAISPSPSGSQVKSPSGNPSSNKKDNDKDKDNGKEHKHTNGAISNSLKQLLQLLLALISQLLGGGSS